VEVADGAYDLGHIGRAGRAAYERQFSDASIARALGQALQRLERLVR
jgi:hypothetical protein